MENAVQIRGATAQDAQVFFALNLAFNGEGVASPQEAALALAHPGPERVLLAFVAGEPAGFLCGLLKRSACYSRPSAEVLRLLLSALRRGDGAVRLPRLPPPGRGPAAAGGFSGRLPPRGRGGRHGAHRGGQRPRPGLVSKDGLFPQRGGPLRAGAVNTAAKNPPGFPGDFQFIRLSLYSQPGAFHRRPAPVPPGPGERSGRPGAERAPRRSSRNRVKCGLLMSSGPSR